VINDQVRKVAASRADIKDREFLALIKQGELCANVLKNLALPPCAERIRKSDPLIPAKVSALGKLAEPLIVKACEGARLLSLIFVHL
jgi:hypothetical protein